MRRTIKQAVNGKTGKAQITDRTRKLLDRIRRRREQIRERVGVLSDSCEVIREERDRRF